MIPGLADYPHPTSPAATARMKGNRRADTKPERALRAALHARGLRFRKDLLVRTAGGTRAKVDVVFTRARVAVFIDGCFWHGCPEHGSAPKGNSTYWAAKISGNRERDQRVTAALEAEGWTVVRLWEHEALDLATERVVEAVARATPCPERSR
jgi:DNA mismatch endonuclease (patch repair protein)